MSGVGSIRRSGFTLMEVIVGLTVAALALSAGFATLAFISDRDRPTDAAAALALRGATTRNLLVAWLSEARLQGPRSIIFTDVSVDIGSGGGASSTGGIPSTGGSSSRGGGSRSFSSGRVSVQGDLFQGFDETDQGTPSDEIIFPTTASTPLGVSTSVVRLFVDRDERTPQRGLVAELTERVTDEPRLVELVPEVGAMDIRYLQPLAGTTGEWVTVWSSNSSLPRAVEIVLAAAPPDTLPSLLSYPILVPLEATR